MADNKTITSANSSYFISVEGLFDTPVELKGYAADKAWATESVDLAEALMGVDGKASYGYTPNLVKQTITCQADSDSNDVFDTIADATRTTQEVFIITGTINLPGTKENWNMIKGTLTKHKPMPDGQKTLQPRDYEITWESVQKSPT